MVDEIRLSQEDIRIIERALTEKRRVEIVQTKNGLKIYNVSRKELNSPVRG